MNSGRLTMSVYYSEEESQKGKCGQEVIITETLRIHHQNVLKKHSFSQLEHASRLRYFLFWSNTKLI